MPIQKPWRRYDADEIPTEKGIYELGWQRSIIYIGCAKNLRKRIRAHYNDNCDHQGETCNFHQIRFVTEDNCEDVFSYREKELYEQLQFKRKKGRLPLRNHQVG